ncbi:hypothetical protein ACFSUS_02550 [Spirosoma soli]|uniref:Lipoprotein n=1 Tax=Spirosoma soli TaxID=1770529 RepID=A0ABW5LXH6_9BACT
MKQLFIIGFVGLAGIVSCSPDSTVAVVNPVVTVKPAPDESVNRLHEQFHGKYRVISSVSIEPLDINFDGVASLDMVQELAELQTNDRTKYCVELRIYGPTQKDPKTYFSFMQWWPEQSIRLGNKYWDNNELIAYDPKYVVNYDFQGASRSFSFSTDLKQITVNPNDNEKSFRWGRPESVTIDDNGRLRVVNKRRLYSKAGVKDVVITTVYERFTMTT